MQKESKEFHSWSWQWEKSENLQMITLFERIREQPMFWIVKTGKPFQEEKEHERGFTFSSRWEKEVAFVKVGKKKADKILTHSSSSFFLIS